MKTSLFGINDCRKPIKNTKKKYLFKKNYRTAKIYRIKSVFSKSDFPNIILFPHDLGQTKHGVEKAPFFLKRFINIRNHKVIKIKNSHNLFTNLKALYDANEKMIGKRVNIGGDHSMAIATLAYTLNKFPNAKVIYFDAHADINTYKSSNSKHYHGMPLSFITGLDSNKKFSYIKNKLPFNNLLYIGSRCFDIFERNMVYEKNIKFIEPDEINNNIQSAMNKIMEFAGDSPVHISFDVDSIDPKYIPSTGTPVKNGIELNKAISIINNLNTKNVVNVDITELNMDLGSKRDGIKSGKNTGKLFRNFLD